MLPAPHPIGLAAPGYVEHRLPMHLCQVGQRQLATLIDMSLRTYMPCLRGLLFSSTGNQTFCDSFDTGRGPLYMAILFVSQTAKDRCNVLEFLWSPRFATMEHNRASASLAHLATYHGWEVSGGLDRQEFPELSPGYTAPGSNGIATAPTRAQHISKVAESGLHIKKSLIWS